MKATPIIPTVRLPKAQMISFAVLALISNLVPVIYCPVAVPYPKNIRKSAIFSIPVACNKQSTM